MARRALDSESKRVQVVKDGAHKIAIESGRGVPENVLARIAAAKESSDKSKLEAVTGIKKKGSKFQALLDQPFETFSNADSTSTKSTGVSEYSMLMNLDEYDFPDDEALTPKQLGVNLDVTALDRYNEDVRKYRRALLESCRLLPHSGDVNPLLMERIRITAAHLCRACYYGTPKAQRLAEGGMLVLIWLLNRRNVTILFHMRVLQSVAEMVWNSPILKIAFLEVYGINVVTRLLRSGILHHSDLGCWAAYALLAACVGNGEVIAKAQDFPNMDEYVGEITFPYYWRDWPANFGYMLQGVLYGPHSVAPLEDEFSFL